MTTQQKIRIPLKTMIMSVAALIAWDLWLDHYYDQKDMGYTKQQVKAVDTLVASLSSSDCSVGDWLCVVDKYSRR